MVTLTIGGKTFTDMLCGGADRLAAYRQDVNDLNVFPIPDGDTGDNMLMTFGSGAEAAKNAGEHLGNAAKAAAHGMLLGARGNSGVILSRIFSGITREFEGLEEADTSALIRGMKSGVTEAYNAVSVPVEGTILTVFKDAVSYANARAAEHGENEINKYFDNLLFEMKRSLERTPELLPVLSEAGVVDSGGAGLLRIFEGMRDALLGKPGAYFVGESNTSPQGDTATSYASKNVSLDFSLFDQDSILKYGYCTEFLLRLQSAKTDVDSFDIDYLVSNLENIGGESIVAFKDGSIVKVHVHTMTPGKVIDFCQRFGEFLTMKIENMTLQNSEAVSHGDNAQSTLERKSIKRRKKNGIVAVASGEGIKDTFLSLGVDYVVEGGQSMNPSAGDLIKAFDEVNAERIFVFPNNGNVILTAKQAAELYENSEIVVIESHNIGQGYSAISMMDTNGDTGSIKSELDEVMSEVVTGYVSEASKNTEINGVTVKAGDYIGFVGDTIYADSDSREKSAEMLLSQLDTDNFGVMLMIVGAKAEAECAQALYKTLSEKYRSLEIIMIDGAQPVYDYIIILE